MLSLLQGEKNDGHADLSITLSVAEFVDGARVVPILEAKSLFRLALPDRELGRSEVPINGVPGIEEEGVSSPLSKSPFLAPGPLLSRRIELRRSSTSLFLGVKDPALVYGIKE